MKPKLDRCKTCSGTDLNAFEADGAMGIYPVVWCENCGTLHKHYFSDADWTWTSPKPAAEGGR